MAGIRNFRFVALIGGLVAVLVAVVFVYRGRLEGNGEVAASVNDAEIPMADLQSSLDNLLNHFRSMGMQIDSSHVDSLRTKVLDSMISTELLYQEARNSGIEVADEDVSKEIESITRQHPSEAEFQEVLAKQGLTIEKLRKELDRSLTIRRYVDEKISKSIVISPEEQRQYYESHQGNYRHDEQVAARHIVIQAAQTDPPESLQSKKARLEGIRARAVKGEDFAALAKEHSQDPVAHEGGDLGYFSRGSMVKPFEDAAFSLKPGEVSPVIRTQYGFHVIQVYDRRPAGVSTFEEVEPSIEEALKREKMNLTIETMVQDLRKKADVEIKL